jgi:3-oxoacyl-[acyl-carrier protein] reductase
VIGCSRAACEFAHPNYRHFNLDICDDNAVEKMFAQIRADELGLDILINNAGIGSMNHALLTPTSTAARIMSTNVVATFQMCREAAKIMSRNKFGRIVNFATVATPLRLEGEAIYAASKAAVLSLTQILGREFAPFGITVNAVGPTPIRTDLIAAVPQQKLEALLERQAFPRFGEFSDVSNVIDFFIRPESAFITGQTIFLGGVS